MDYTLLCGLPLLFFTVVIADLAGHGMLNIRRSIQEWIRMFAYKNNMSYTL